MFELDKEVDNGLVTDTLEYKGKKVKFSLHKFEADKSKKNVAMLWYIDAQVEGFKKPFQSKMFTSVFARDRYEEAKKLNDPQEYLNALFRDADKIMAAKCELLTVDLDSISIMWYCDGTVQLETDTNLVTMVKSLIDHLDQDVSKLVLTNSGFL